MELSSVQLRSGDSLSDLFKEQWENVYNLKVNNIFRRRFPSPDYIVPGYFIHFPSHLPVNRAVPYRPDNVFSPSHQTQDVSKHVCYILLFKDSGDRYRKRHLYRILDRLRAVGSLEIIVVEQGDQPSSLPSGIVHLFARNPYSFNRGWGFNIGLKHTSRPIVVFADNDIIVQKQNLLSSCEKCSEFDAVTPYFEYYDLSKGSTESYYDRGVILFNSKRRSVNISSGILVMRREAALRIGGWEEFDGWGSEDDVQAYKIGMLLTHATCDGPAFHLFHEKAQLPERNLIQSVQEYERMDQNDLKQYCIESSHSIGRLNKYEV